MPARLFIILTLMLSLLFGTPVQSGQRAATMKRHGCAAMTCEHGCCQSMLCCAPQGKNAPQPMPAPQRGGPDLAAIGLFTALFLHDLPPVEVRFAATRMAAVPHALPRLAVSCIFRI